MNLNVNVNLELRQSHAQLHTHHRLTRYIIIATIYKPSHRVKNWWVMGQHLVTHDPCDPSDFRDPFDPWPIDPFPVLGHLQQTCRTSTPVISTGVYPHMPISLSHLANDCPASWHTWLTTVRPVGTPGSMAVQCIIDFSLVGLGVGLSPGSKFTKREMTCYLPPWKLS